MLMCQKLDLDSATKPLAKCSSTCSSQHPSPSGATTQCKVARFRVVLQVQPRNSFHSVDKNKAFNTTAATATATPSWAKCPKWA